MAQVKSAWQTGCWAANTNTFFARSRIFAKVSFVYKDRSLCAQQPICDNSLLQSALCFHWASALVFGVLNATLFAVVSENMFSMQRLFSVYLLVRGQRNTFWGFWAQTALCSCAHVCRPQYSLQIVRKTQMYLLHSLRVADESQPKSDTTKILDKLHILQIVQNFSNHANLQQCRMKLLEPES